MSSPPSSLPVLEPSGPEARWLREVGTPGRPVPTRRDVTAPGPARHVREHDRRAVGTPTPAAAVPGTASRQVDGLRSAARTGWTVTVPGAVEVTTRPGGAAHHRRTPAGWAHGPHHCFPRPRPLPTSTTGQDIAGFRGAGPGA